MKNLACFFILALIALSSCSSNGKPYYKTKSGKKKQKYYNDIQYGGKNASEMKKLKND